MKKQILLGLLLSFLLVPMLVFFVNAQGPSNQPVPNCMKTNVLDITTGYDFSANAWYGNCADDAYWTLTSTNDGQSVPRCARILLNAPAPFDQWSYNWRQLSVRCNDADAQNNTLLCASLCGSQNIYTFRRDFWVDLPVASSVNINYNFFCAYDDAIQGIWINGQNIGSTTCGQDTITFAGTTSTGIVHGGLNSITVSLYNQEFGILCSLLGVSPLRFNMLGNMTASTATPLFLRNDYFVPNTNPTWGCHSPNVYVDTPRLSGYCKQLNDTTMFANVSILNFDTTHFDFILNPGNINLDTNSFVGILGQTYTVTAVDPKGCGISTSVKVAFGPDFTLTPQHQCIPPGQYGTVTVQVLPGGMAPYKFQLDTNGYTYPVGYYLTQGVYTISVMDSNKCFTSKLDTVGNRFKVQTTTYPNPPCLNPGDTVQLQVFSNPIGIADTFWMNGNLLGFNVNQILVPITTPGTYSFHAVDTFGCFADTTKIVANFPMVTASIGASVGCINVGGSAVLTITATGTQTPYEYRLNGPGGTTAWQSSTTFTVTVSGQYNLDVKGLGGCIVSNVAGKYIGDCGKCSNSNFAQVPGNATWYGTGLSSVTFGTATPTSPIVIDGVITVNSNLSMLNNPNIYFTHDSYLSLNNGNITLTINQSVLRGCDWWTGIRAQDIGNTVSISNSTIMHMYRDTYGTGWNTIENQAGINLKNGALGSIKNNVFDLNMFGVIVCNTPNNYNGVFQGNQFGLLSTPFYGAFAFLGIDCKKLTIGGLNNNNEGNLFAKFRRGICITSKYKDTSTINTSLNYYLYNNTFQYMGDLPGINTITTEYNCYQDDNGAISGASSTATGITTNIWVDNVQMDNSVVYYLCNNGIYTKNCNLSAKNCVMDRCLKGIYTTSINFCNYTISNNNISGSQMGISANNGVNKMDLFTNMISTRTNPMLNTVNGITYYFSPGGIDLRYSATMVPTQFRTIRANLISLNYRTGVGINNLNAKYGQQIYDNIVQFNNPTLGSVDFHDVRTLFGVFSSNGKSIDFRRNYILGAGLSDTTLFNARNSIGFYMDNCPNSTLECNKSKYTRYGLYAYGNNLTLQSAIRFNRMNANNFPWYFLDGSASTAATFGNVGVQNADNGNTFIGNINWLNVGNINPGLAKVFRNSNVQPGWAIYTNTNLLQPGESKALNQLYRYLVSSNTIAYTDPCANTPQYDFAPENNEELDSTRIESLIDIVEDSVEYINYPIVGKWIDRLNLFRELDQDSILRNSRSELDSFYNAQQNTNNGSILRADNAIALLFDSTTNTDNFAARYNNAIYLNDLIDGEEIWEINERLINSVQLELIITPTDSISSETRDFILNLAASCPLVEGNAVYKARPLASFWDRNATYDDRIICLSLNNKGLDKLNIDIDQYYLTEAMNGVTNTVNNFDTDKLDGKISTGNNVEVYPNPASDNLTIRYTCHEEGLLIICNSLGQEMSKFNLVKGGLTTVDVAGLTPGIYTYKCRFKNCEDFIGKLTINR